MSKYKFSKNDVEGLRYFLQSRPTNHSYEVQYSALIKEYMFITRKGKVASATYLMEGDAVEYNAGEFTRVPKKIKRAVIKEDVKLLLDAILELSLDGETDRWEAINNVAFRHGWEFSREGEVVNVK